MNKAIYKGRITASPELRSSTTGKSYCRFTIAVDGFKDKSEGKQADFIPCIAWNGTAETIAKFVEKGQEQKQMYLPKSMMKKLKSILLPNLKN